MIARQFIPIVFTEITKARYSTQLPTYLRKHLPKPRKMHSKTGYQGPHHLWNVISPVKGANLLTQTLNTYLNWLQSYQDKAQTRRASGAVAKMGYIDAHRRLRNGPYKKRQSQHRALVGQPVATPEAYGLSYWNE